MHRTIEALYKDGRIIPLGEMIPVREAKVLDRINRMDLDVACRPEVRRGGQ